MDLGIRPAPVDRSLLLAAAPRMPSDFWGEITFTYQAGVLTMAEVAEKLKPIPKT